MTQQPFSRPGAIDLSALKRPPAPPAAGGAAVPGGGPPAGASYWLEVDEQSFQATLEASMVAPVLLVFYSPSRLPESEQMARDLATVAEDYEGRFLAGLVDIDRSPAIAQAVQLPSVPYVFAVLDGRPAPLIQDVLKLDDLAHRIDGLHDAGMGNGIGDGRGAATRQGGRDQQGGHKLSHRNVLRAEIFGDGSRESSDMPGLSRALGAAIKSRDRVLVPWQPPPASRPGQDRRRGRGPAAPA